MATTLNIVAGPSRERIIDGLKFSSTMEKFKSDFTVLDLSAAAADAATGHIVGAKQVKFSAIILGLTLEDGSGYRFFVETLSDEYGRVMFYYDTESRQGYLWEVTPS